MRDSANRSRADVVRRRRKDQANKRLTHSAVMATRVAPPITTRARLASSSMPAGRPAARRRAERSISMPGIEVHMPTVSFSGSEAKWRFVSFSIVVLLIAALYLAGTAPVFAAAPAQITGNQRISAEELNAALGATSQQIFTLVPNDLEKRLRLDFPELSGARVSVALPNEVFVDVVERVPVLEWHQDGGYTWIDSTGVAFRPRGSAEGIVVVQAQDAPRLIPNAAVDPFTPQPFLAPDLVQAVMALAPNAPPGSPIVYDSHHGLGWTDFRGWSVFFGDQSKDMSLKLQVYQAMVQMMNERGIHPAFISVQYPTAPYYRMSQ